MSNIIDYLQKILSSRYGKDVRQAIHDGILTCYEDGKAGAIDLVARQRIDTLESSSLIRKIVDSLPTEDISTTTVYMIPSQQSSQDNIYDEYMYINESWEKIGSSAVDLTDYLKRDGDSSNNTVTFTSNDSGPDGEHAILSVDKLTTGEKISSIMNKISRIFTNTRYILDLLGTNDITSESVKIGDGTVTGALRTLNDSLNIIGTYNRASNVASIEVNSSTWTKLTQIDNLQKGKYLINADVSDRINLHYMRVSSADGVDVVIGNSPYGSKHISTVSDIADGASIAIWVYLAEKTTVSSINATIQAIRIK